MCGCHQVALSFLIRILSFDPKYKDIFREVGLLEVLTNCLRNYGVALKEKFDGESTRVPPEWGDWCVICHGWLIMVWLHE